MHTSRALPIPRPLPTPATLRATLVVALAAVLGAAPLTAAPQGVVNPPVVINEFQYDDSGTDDREFVELYNRSGTPADISGWTLEERSPTALNSTFTVPANTVLPVGGFWVFGPASLPNVNQVVGTTSIWGDGVNALTLRDQNGRIIDTVVYESNKTVPPWNPMLIEGGGVWGNFQSIDAFPTSVARLRDGFDTNDNGIDFRIAPISPGAKNDIPSALPRFDLYDTVPVGSSLTEWGASFVTGKSIDPTVVDANNPNAIPASPQGGNAAIFWDPAGGGNMNMLVTDVVRDVTVEALVYFDAKLEAATYYETWSLGVRGMTGSLFNTPDPGGVFTGFTANGNTGVALTFQVTDTAATLYLVDHNNGGTDFNVLGKVVLQAGVNDGWQRLRLTVQGDRADAWVGGTYGCGDGQHIGGKLSEVHEGGIYLGYREFILNNATTRPLTFDQLSIRAATAAVDRFGAGVATTVGVPSIDVNGLPVIGWNGFRIELRGLKPSSPVGLVVGAAKQTPPINLALLGAPPGAQLLVRPDIVLGLNADAQGQLNVPVPIPCLPHYDGVSLFWQAIDVDTALPYALPFGHTQGLETRLGS